MDTGFRDHSTRLIRLYIREGWVNDILDSHNRQVTTAVTVVTQGTQIILPVSLLSKTRINVPTFWYNLMSLHTLSISTQTLADEKYCSSLNTYSKVTSNTPACTTHTLVALSLTKYTLSVTKYQYRHVRLSDSVRKMNMLEWQPEINPELLVLQFFDRIDVTVTLRP